MASCIPFAGVSFSFCAVAACCLLQVGASVRFFAICLSFCAVVPEGATVRHNDVICCAAELFCVAELFCEHQLSLWLLNTFGQSSYYLCAFARVVHVAVAVVVVAAVAPVVPAVVQFVSSLSHGQRCKVEVCSSKLTSQGYNVKASAATVIVPKTTGSCSKLVRNFSFASNPLRFGESS